MIGGTWLIITFGLLLASLIFRQTPLLLIAVLFFLTSGAARLWARYMLERVDYRRHLSATRVFFGEEITLEISIANRKILPLPWVHIYEEVPDELTFPRGRTAIYHKHARAVLTNFLSLGWYHQITRRYPVQCLKRGYFTFGPATIRSGDLFGFFGKETIEEKSDHLLVYPRIVPLEDLGIPSRAPFGDLKIRRHLFEDPMRVITTRDYFYGDPLKRIHWKATARLRRLQSRVYEPTTTVDLALFLDVRTVEPPLQGQVQQFLEMAVIAAASIASYAVDNSYRIGLYVNHRYRTTGRMIKLPPSAHTDQLQRVLEALAHVQGLSFFPLEQLLNNEARSLPWGTTMVVITAIPNEAILTALSRFQRAGRRVALIMVGGETTRFSTNGFPVYHVSDQVSWRDLESLQLSRGQP